MTEKKESLLSPKMIATIISGIAIAIGGGQAYNYVSSENTDHVDQVCREQVKAVDSRILGYIENQKEMNRINIEMLKEIKDDIREIRNAQRRGR